MLRAALIAPLLLAACTPGSSGGTSEAKQTEAVEAAKATLAPKPAQPTPTPASAPAAGGSGAAGAPAGAAPAGSIGASPAAGSPAPSPGSAAGGQAAGGQASAAAQAAPQPRQGVDPGSLRVVLDPLSPQLDRPLHVTHAGDGSGRLFVVEKPGRIIILRDGQPLPAPFLDIQGVVGSNGSEQGLLGLAFHPRYRENGRFFVNYTDRNGDTVVAEYRASGDPDVADPSTARQLLALDQPAANHNGGHLLFGPDGYLWIGTGDGGGAGDRFGNGQNRQALLGKMLRIDVDTGDPYGIPADNPHANGGDTRPEIWAIGLRNPWRYTFDRATNDLWIADVGQNAYEEVNVHRAGSQGGENYGWPIMEGMHCFPAGRACDTAPYVMPVGEYGRDGGCSITGGYVYRGSQYPELAGLYLFGDFCTGKLWSLDEPTPGDWRMVELLDTPLQISSFGEDEAGELYVTSFHDNRVHRVTLGS